MRSSTSAARSAPARTGLLIGQPRVVAVVVGRSLRLSGSSSRCRARARRCPQVKPGEHAPLGGALRLLRRERLVLLARRVRGGRDGRGRHRVVGRAVPAHAPAVGAASWASRARSSRTRSPRAHACCSARRPDGGAPARGVTIGASTAAAGILLLALAPGAWLQGRRARDRGRRHLDVLAVAARARDRGPGTAGRGRRRSLRASATSGSSPARRSSGWASAIGGLQAGLVVLAVAAVFVAVAPNLSRPRPVPSTS